VTGDALLRHHRRPDLLFEEVFVGDARLWLLGLAAGETKEADAPEDEGEGPGCSKVTLSIPDHDL
jgi:hypothetical protein